MEKLGESTTARDVIERLKKFPEDTEIRVAHQCALTGETYYTYVDYIFLEEVNNSRDEDNNKIEKEFILIM